jgi:integrase/recombinase XerC
MINKFLQYLQYEKNYSSHTVLSYKSDLFQFEDFVFSQTDANDLLKVESNHIRLFLVDLMSTGLSPRTANRKLSSLKSFYKFLIHEQVVTKNPARNVISPKMKKPLPSFFKESEVQDVLDNLLVGEGFEQFRDNLIIDLFYETGIRISELLNIRDEDIDFYSKSLRVIGKRNKERQIPLGSNLITKIKDYQVKRDAEVALSAKYFFVKYDGEKMYAKLVYNIVKKYMSQVSSMSKTSPHVLRHTFASTLLNNGADLNAVKELLGHANLSATEVYTHTSFEQLQKIYKQAHPRA